MSKRTIEIARASASVASRRSAPAICAGVLGLVSAVGCSSSGDEIAGGPETKATHSIPNADGGAGTNPPTGQSDASLPPTPSDGGDQGFDGGVVPPNQCDLSATPANFVAQFAAATPGQVVCLAAGTYGTFKGGSKSGRVYVRPQTGAAVTMGIEFSNAKNITVDGMSITSADVSRSRDITISHCRFVGQAILHVGIVADANIVLDANTHVNTPNCTACFPGRVHVDPEGNANAGVAIKNSLFDGGQMDGVRADATGILIEGNEFRNLVDQDPYHTDPIQIYGGHRVTIRRNYFHDNSVAAAIGGWDGNDHNIIEDNVIVGSTGLGVSIAQMSDNGSIIRHNTLVQGTCAYNWKCGILRMDHKVGDPPSTGTVVRDNILSEITNTDAVGVTMDHNLFTGTQTPVYVGPMNSAAGYRLAPTSPGKSAASDGVDIGIR